MSARPKSRHPAPRQRPVRRPMDEWEWVPPVGVSIGNLEKIDYGNPKACRVCPLRAQRTSDVRSVSRLENQNAFEHKPASAHNPRRGRRSGDTIVVYEAEAPNPAA